MGALDIYIKETRSTLSPVLKNYIERVREKKLRTLLKYCVNVKEAYNRALFVRLGCEAVGGDWRKILQAMAAVEFMNSSVVVIDDILDEVPTRIRKPAAYKAWGEKCAVIVAPILKSLATNALIEAAQKNHLDTHKLSQVVLLLETSHQRMYIGQYLDITYENVEFSQVTEKMYLEMIEHTTGFDLSASCSMGAILGKGKEKEVEALRQLGLNLGLIFQIRDDLIDYIDDERLIRKTSFSDFIRRKKRLPLLLALNLYADVEEKEILIKFLEKRTLQKVDKSIIAGIIAKSNIIGHIRSLIEPMKKKALKMAEKFHDERVKDVMFECIELGSSI